MFTSISFFKLSLFFLIRHISATENGIVGFGISLYQDLCCQSCHDSLSSLYLSCTAFSGSDGASMDMSMGVMGITSDECYATNSPWLQTMAYCIQQNCHADGYSAENQVKCFSTHAVAGASEPTLQNSLPAVAPTVEVPADSMWLNVTSLVNSDTYYAIHGTLGEFARSEYIHTRYSLLLYLIVIGICIGAGILAQTRGIFPGFQKKLQSSTLWTKLQQYIFLPALFGSRRLEPLPGNMCYIPSRTLSIFISIYIILNVILSSISFRNFSPNTWFASDRFEMCEYVGNRTGTLSLVNMSIAILFAGRNNILIAVTGWNRTAFLTLHCWVARVAALQAVVHSIAYTVAYLEPEGGGAVGYAAEVAKPFYWWGIIATIALCLATFFAVLPLRTKSYEIFLIIHITLVILSLVGCWYHLIPHFGYSFGYQVWLYIAFAFWTTDRVARILRLAYYNRLAGSAAIVEAIPGCDIMQVTLFPRVAWRFRPGQHSFLYLPTLGKFWESHPFSIAGWKTQEQSLPSASTSPSLSDSSTATGETVKESGRVTSKGTDKDSPANIQPAPPPPQSQSQNHKSLPSIRFLIRAHSGITSTLHRRLTSSPTGSPLNLKIYTEGPYAGHMAILQPLQMADTVLCLVGGIGITHALGYLQEYKRSITLASSSSESGETQRRRGGTIMARANRFILAWSAREMPLIAHVEREFLSQMEGVEGVEVSIWCTGDSDCDFGVGRVQIGDQDDESHKEKAAGKVRLGSEVSVKKGRMDVAGVIRASLETGLLTTIVACGPGAMVDEATRQVVRCVSEGLRVEMIEEAYAW